MNKLLQLLMAGSFLCASVTFAQEDSTAKAKNEIAPTSETSATDEKIENLKGKLSGLEESYLETKATADKLKKIKISGYIQTQIRYAPDTAGQVSATNTNNYEIGEFQGGKLPTITQSVFQLRRARLKIGYETNLTQAYIQLDCLPFTTANAIEKVAQDTSGKYTVKPSNKAYLSGGGVSVKDAYFKFNEPWTSSFGLKMGIFDRPFGYEISYSSSSRESPERSRIFQTLFPGERDLGISLEYLPADNLPKWAQYFNFKGGYFAGNGINVEFDDLRDFIGRFGLSIPLTAVNMSIDGGVSGYVGSIRDRADSLYEPKSNGLNGSKGHKWTYIDRQYIGADLEYYFGDVPFLGGVCLRGEYISGKQPGTATSSSSQKSDLANTSPVYLRNFNGFYGTVVLNVDPIKCQIVGKYDMYDPNTNISGSKITNTTDIKYTTIGGGLIYHWNENVKLMAYYDKVENETMSEKSANAVKAPWFSKNLNDDVFTFRIQYKF